MQLSRLVLPAPLGPMIAATVPFSAVNEMSRSAATPPKRRERLQICRCAILSHHETIAGDPASPRFDPSRHQQKTTLGSIYFLATAPALRPTSHEADFASWSC